MEKVTMSNAEVIGLAECLNEMTKAGADMKPRTWFTLAANRKALIEKGKLIDEANTQINNKYKGEENGEQVIPKENLSKWQEERAEVLAIQVEVELYKLSLSDLEKEMPKMKGINNLYLLFDYMVDGDLETSK